MGELTNKELMVGNYVLCHDHGWYSDGTVWKEDKICTVMEINKRHLSLAYNNDGVIEVDDFKISECEGIPITVDVLEKIGFRHFILGQMVCEGKEKDQVVTIITDTRVFPNCSHKCLCGIFNGYTNAKVGVTYLHELQNALTVCGIELIKLTNGISLKANELRLQHDTQG